MRPWPLVATACVAALYACTAPVAPPSESLVTAPSVAPSDAASAAATPSLLSPTATATPSPSPSPTATPSPSPLSPSPSPTQLTTVPDANHGAAPFPSAPPGNTPIGLNLATVSAGTGNPTARGAIDGDLYSEWSARQGVGPNTWLAIDLGAPVSLARMDVLPDASPDVKVFFNVDLSADGTHWTTVGSGTATGSNATPTWGSAVWTPQSARYVRLTPTSWGASWVAVWDVRLYGSNSP